MSFLRRLVPSPMFSMVPLSVVFTASRALLLASYFAMMGRVYTFDECRKVTGPVPCGQDCMIFAQGSAHIREYNQRGHYVISAQQIHKLVWITEVETLYEFVLYGCITQPVVRGMHSNEEAVVSRPLLMYR